MKRNPKEEVIVTAKIQQTSTNRTPKDVGNVKLAIQGAESVHNPSRTQLYDLYEHVMQDGHLTSVYQKLLNSILNKNLHFQDKSGRRIEEMESAINSPDFSRIIEGIVESNFFGVTGLEFLPGPVLDVKVIPRKHIRPSNKVITIHQSDTEGIPYESLSNVWILEGENGLGILSVCAPYVVYKMACLGDWAQFIELFGQPVRILRYDAHDSNTKMQLMSILDNSGSSLCLMLPRQAEFEMLDGKEGSSDGELFSKMVKYLDGQVSVIVLGVTETMVSSEKSGLAQAEVHAEQQEKKVLSYLKYVEACLNEPKFLRILKSYGLPVQNGRFVFEKQIELKNLKLRAQLDEMLVKTYELNVDHDYVYKTYGIPKPDNYEEIMAKRKKLELHKELQDMTDEEVQDTFEKVGMLDKMRSFFGFKKG